MNKIIVKILIGISILIICFGISASNSVKDEILKDKKMSEKIYIDGSDATDVMEGIVDIGARVLGFAMILYSFLAVGSIWGIYGIILLTICIVKKIKRKK